MRSDPGTPCEEFPGQQILGIAMKFLVTGWAGSYLGVSATIFITVFKSPARGNQRWEVFILAHTSGDRSIITGETGLPEQVGVWWLCLRLFAHVWWDQEAETGLEHTSKVLQPPPTVPSAESQMFNHEPRRQLTFNS